MSHLSRLRLVFHGRFQADVSTVNNDVRHFDNEAFIDAYQTPQAGAALNGWWNPDGTGAFRLSDCQVTELGLGDGSVVHDRGVLPIGLAISDANDRVSGKLVDLDPQWQMASAIWGLTVRLVAEDGTQLMAGRFEAAPFRDLAFGRSPAPGSGGASASFTSVLTDLAWADDLRARAMMLDELRRATQGGVLAIRLMTYAYVTAASRPGFTFGRVSGVIGPFEASRPRSFVLGRRLVPSPDGVGPGAANFCDAVITEGGDGILIDLGNAIPLDGSFVPVDMGPLKVVALSDESVVAGGLVAPDRYIPIGSIEGYANEGFLTRSGGVVDVRGSVPAIAAARSRPIAILMGDGAATTALWRETKEGRLVRAEQFVQRPYPGDVVRDRLWAAQWGVPLPSATIALQLLPPIPNMGGSGRPTPNVPIPTINEPPSALTLPATLVTGSNGFAPLAIQTRDPGAPRGYVDGQIYLISYNFPGDQAIEQPSVGIPLDCYALLLFSAFQPKHDPPTWGDDIEPIMQQYANLYPVMSRFLFDLGDEQAVGLHQKLLAFAFGLPLEHPNHMPVTRDLSPRKRDAILAYLASVAPLPAAAVAEMRPAAAHRPTAAVQSADASAETDGKQAFAASIAAALAATSEGKP